MPHLEDDMIAFGEDIDGYLQNDGLQGDPMLQKCAVIVRELPMIPRECVVRGHLTGSAYKANVAGELVCGHDIGMRDMQEGTILMPPIFTPTTKAESGHDLPLDYREVEAEYPGLGELSVRIFEFFYKRARNKGIITADTKLEFAYRQLAVPRRKIFILADEAFTPDSSRFWDIQEFDWAFTQKKLPPSLDKQPLRNWGKEVGIDKLDPESPDDLEFVASLPAPEEVINNMRQRMLDAFVRLHDVALGDFQRVNMDIRS